MVLSIPDLIPVPIVLQGWAADAAFASESVDVAETVMGVDGRMSAGFTPNVVRVPIEFMPDSPSLDAMDQWRTAMQSSKEVLFANAVITIPSIARIYNCRNGVLTKATPIPKAAKVLQAVAYEITFESVQPALE